MKKMIMMVVMVMAMALMSMTAFAGKTEVEKIETETIETETIIDGTADEAEQIEHKAWYKAAADAVCGAGKAVGNGAAKVGKTIGTSFDRTVKHGVGTAFVTVGNFEVRIGNWLLKK